ncbi:MAG: glycosyltransferase, partial [Thermotogota bacterium]
KAFANDQDLREKAHLIIVVRGVQDVYNGVESLKDTERKIVKEWLYFIKENKLKNHISFFNAENQKDLAALYRSARENRSVFCNPALYEPFGLTVIEAMSCGLPVAATRNGGPSEILRENGFKYGFLFDPEDVKSIIDTLKKSLMGEKEYKKYSELSVTRVLEKYTWKKTAEDYLREIKAKIADYKPKDIDLSSFFKALQNHS